MQWARADEAARLGEQALAYADEHEEHTFIAYTAMMLAWLRLRAGEWDEVERLAQDEIARSASVRQLLAKTVLAELAVRRGDADAGERLDDLVAQADATGEIQRLVPVVELAAEQALTGDGPMPPHRIEQLLADVRTRGRERGWSGARVAALGGARRARPGLRAAARREPFAAMADARLGARPPRASARSAGRTTAR